MPEGTPLLEVEGLVKQFHTRRGTLRAIRGLDLGLLPGETLGVVGESGCGKSTLARLLVRLETADAGRIRLGGEDLGAARGQRLRRLRRRIQLVFQDPFASLNPRMTVHDLVAEPWLSYPDVMPRSKRRAEVLRLLDQVGLPAAAAAQYPHEFSGGQRQRIGIARALSLRPDVIVLDEPISALDLSVQAQVLNLLAELQRELGVSYVFIAHDLSVVRYVAHRVAVMYLGRIVETGPVGEVYEQPAHPYTRALLGAVPVVDPHRTGRRARTVLAGDLPSPLNPPTGCSFRSRCPLAAELCADEDPELVPRPAGGRLSACHFAKA